MDITHPHSLKTSNLSEIECVRHLVERGDVEPALVFSLQTDNL
jgi:hypothetical protein